MPPANPAPAKPLQDAGDNRLSPVGDRKVSRTKGDLPPSVLDRYLIERDGRGRAERFFRDHRAAAPSFTDRGRTLVAGQTYPDTVADMLKIARHRGWTQIQTRGDDAFRREVWVQAQALDIAVKGYRPTERDRQAASPSRDRAERAQASADRVASGKEASHLSRRMEMAAVVVRTLVADPEARARLLDRAWVRATEHLERGRRLQAPREPIHRTGPETARRRDRGR